MDLSLARRVLRRLEPAGGRTIGTGALLTPVRSRPDRKVAQGDRQERVERADSGERQGKAELTAEERKTKEAVKET